MLTEPQLQAAELVARDRLSLAAIARKVNVSFYALRQWVETAEFRSEVERILNLWAQEIEKHGICDKRRRLHRLNDRWRRGQAFIEKRAKLFRKLLNTPAPPPVLDSEGNVLYQPESIADLLANVPAGETGLVAWKIKTLHVGENTWEKVVEYEWDTGFDQEMRALEEQAAIETGQWKPKQEISISGVGGGPIRITNLSALTDDELELLTGIARKLQAGGSGSGTPLPQAEPNAETVSGPGTAPAGTLPQAP